MFIFTGSYTSLCLCRFRCLGFGVKGEMGVDRVILGDSPINTPWMGWKRILKPGSGSKRIESHV